MAKRNTHTRDLKEWWMAPLWDGVRGCPDIVVAWDLHFAFGQARRTWPTADGWEFIGMVDSKDRECSRKVKESGTRQLLILQPPKKKR